ECHLLLLLGLFHEAGQLPLDLLGVTTAEHRKREVAHSWHHTAYTPSSTVSGSGSGLASASDTPFSMVARTSASIAACSSSVSSWFTCSHARYRSTGSRAVNSSTRLRGTYAASSWTAWPSIRSVTSSSSVGPPPARAFSMARAASRETFSTSVPPTPMPSKP